MYSTGYCWQILMKLEFSIQIFEKSSNNKFHQNPSNGSRVVPCGRTDRHEEADRGYSQFYLSAYKAKGPTAPVHIAGACRGTTWGECLASRSTALPLETEPLVLIKQELCGLRSRSKDFGEYKFIGAGGNGIIAPRCPVESQTLLLLSYSGALPLQTVYCPVLWTPLCYTQ